MKLVIIVKLLKDPKQHNRGSTLLSTRNQQLFHPAHYCTVNVREFVLFFIVVCVVDLESALVHEKPAII